MKKSLVFGIVLILLLGLVYAQNYLTVSETSNLNSGNQICERYNHKFRNVGDKASISVNGVTFNIEYIGLKERIESDGYVDKLPQWKVNGFEDTQEGQYSDVYNIIYNNNLYPRDKGENIGIQSFGLWDNGEIKGGEIKIEEKEYYPQDCVGLIKDEWGNEIQITSYTIPKEGWYLISNYIRPSYGPSNEELIDQDKDILSEWYLNPIEQKYYNMEELERKYEVDYGGDEEARDYEQQKQQELENRIGDVDERYLRFEDLSFLPAMFREGDSFLNFIWFFEVMETPLYSRWIYIKESGVGKKLISTHYIRGLEDDEWKIGSQVMFKGWNSLAAYPGIKNIALDYIKGDCIIEKSHRWDPRIQRWIEITSDKWSDNTLFANADLEGFGFMIKVTNDCRLGIIKDTSPPPGLPIQ